ncbi:hypothetical protein SEVIR_4G251401v4 [Setaria viridis]|uniref:DUF7597 domain-containing protein n=1 Tax=Setaria viridis TaxID=4556 RepID=A0A4U6V4F6_SETVI|nr:hypothetical protein SEVIR_4G251401v2 [Setaria viridis]
MEEEDGGLGRRIRATVSLAGNPVKRHEEFMIATTEEILSPAQKLALMHDIRDYITIEARKQVRLYSHHPHGIGIYQLRDVCQRDILVRSSPHWVGPHLVSFVNHDKAKNYKRSPYSRTGWIMLLGYPLAYKESHFINQACSPFGKVIHWHHTDTSLGRVLVKALQRFLEVSD